MRNFKKVIKLLSVVAFMAVLGLPGPGHTADYTMKIGTVMTGEDNPWIIGANHFKKVVEKATQNKLDVQIFVGAKLGGERQVIEGLKLGTVEGFCGSTGTLGNFLPAANVLNLPYIFKDYQQAFRILEGPYGQDLCKQLENVGIKVLGWWRLGPRDIILRNKAVNNLSDLKGLKIRTMETAPAVALYKAYGAIPTPIPWAEVYTAMQQGVVDGCSTNYLSWSIHLHEVSKYYCANKEFLVLSLMAISKKWFDKLPIDIQSAIIDAEKDARVVERKADIDVEDTYIKKWKDSGVKFTYPDTAMFRKAAITTYAQFENEIGKENLAKIIKLSE